MGKSATEGTPSCSGNTGCSVGTVTRVIDGDTIEVDGVRIRLALTDMPESYQLGYNEATEFTKSLCPKDSEVLVDQDDGQPYDRYDRVVGKVFCGNKILNAELLFEDHARILTKYCSVSEFASEYWAREYGC